MTETALRCARLSRGASFLVLAAGYAVALGASTAVVALLSSQPIWLRIAAADVVATVLVFCLSVSCDNSSCYDPYWSVAPVPMAIWLGLTADAQTPLTRRVLVVTLVFTWGARLTWNWARGFRSVAHEDWRYKERRPGAGRAYWPLSFAGFHLMPTLVVLLGLLPLLPGLSTGRRPIGWLDAAALAVTGGAILLEASADRQLHAFRRSLPASGTILATGLWSRCRHPNYLGEIGFWWGIWLFGVAGCPSDWWWTLGGPVAITCLFAGISVPLIERRAAIRRPGWGEHARRVPALIPRMECRNQSPQRP